MKRFLVILFSTSVLFAACKKSSSSTSNTSYETIVSIPYSGLPFFSNSLLNFNNDTLKLQFSVSIISPYTLSTDMTIEVAVDDNKRTLYNTTGSLQYEAMPADAYLLPTTSLTIAAGTRTVLFDVSFIKGKIDESKNFMLPIVIKSGSRFTISSDYGTIYYHSIGNNISGTYNLTGARYNFNGPVNYVMGSGASGVLSTTTDLSSYSPKVITPINLTISEMDYANLGSSGWKYEIEYDSTTGTIAGIEPNQVMLKSITPGSFKVYLSDYDSLLHKMHLITEFTNTLGNGRLVEETLTKQ